MCRGFMQTGECSYGDRCKFTHGPGDTRELRLSFSSGRGPGQGPPGPPMDGGDDPPGLMMPGMPMMVRSPAPCQLSPHCACAPLLAEARARVPVGPPVTAPKGSRCLACP